MENETNISESNAIAPREARLREKIRLLKLAKFDVQGFSPKPPKKGTLALERSVNELRKLLGVPGKGDRNDLK